MNISTNGFYRADTREDVSNDHKFMNNMDKWFSGSGIDIKTDVTVQQINSQRRRFDRNNKGQQYVDTDLIAKGANKLDSSNQTITNHFNKFMSTAKKLEDKWRSPAGSLACTFLYQLISANEVRETVLQNYVNILKLQVNPGYEITEMINTTLADKFK